MAILSLAFSSKQQRIGCIVNHYGLVFWDFKDRFQTKKLIKKGEGEKI